MTKLEANKIKKILNENELHFNYYYTSKSGELRICFYKRNVSGAFRPNEDDISKTMAKILNTLSSNGTRPKYRKDKTMYQGFIDCRYLIFE